VPTPSTDQLGLDVKQVFGDPPEELARYGARLVLASYLEAEVSEHLGASWYDRTRQRQGYRNGVRRREVTCGWVAPLACQQCHPTWPPVGW
jgi:hypothetical protein